MKLFKTSLIAALSLTVLAAPAGAQDLKVGIVDMERVFKEYHKTKVAEDELATRREEARADVDSRKATFDELKGRLEDLAKQIQDPGISTDVKAARQKQFESVREEALAAQDELRQFLERRQAQLTVMFEQRREEILEELTEAVAKKSTVVGYDLVFDKSATSTRSVPFLLYSKDARDFSAEMIEELNAGQ